MRSARAARAASSAVIGPRFQRSASFTAPARSMEIGPAGTFSAGTLPERAPVVWMELLMVLSPPVGLALSRAVTAPVWFMVPERGSGAGRLDSPAAPAGNCGHAQDAATQNDALHSSGRTNLRGGIYIHRCTIFNTHMYII